MEEGRFLEYIFGLRKMKYDGLLSFVECGTGLENQTFSFKRPLSTAERLVLPTAHGGEI